MKYPIGTILIGKYKNLDRGYKLVITEVGNFYYVYDVYIKNSNNKFIFKSSKDTFPIDMLEQEDYGESFIEKVIYPTKLMRLIYE